MNKQNNDQTKTNSKKTNDVERLPNGTPWYEHMVSRPPSSRIPRPISL